MSATSKSNKRGNDQQVVSDDAKRSRTAAIQEMKSIAPIVKALLGTNVLELDSTDLFLEWIWGNTENQPAELARLVLQYMEDKWADEIARHRLCDDTNVDTTKRLCAYVLKNKRELITSISLTNLYELYVRALVKTESYIEAAKVSFDATNSYIPLTCYGTLQSLYEGLKAEGKDILANQVNWYMYPCAGNKQMYDEYVKNQALMCTFCNCNRIDIMYSCGCCISCESCWTNQYGNKEEPPKCKKCDKTVENIHKVRIGQ